MKRSEERWWRRTVGAGAIWTVATVAHAAPVTWNGGSGNWSEPVKWSGSQVPGGGDQVVIPVGSSVALTNATAQLGSLELSGTLTFSKWTTALNATNIQVKAGATMTHALCDTNAAPDNVNRVWIVCTDLTIDVDGSINVNAVGFKGGLQNTTVGGQGTGGGRNGVQTGAGGSYGGEGGLATFTSVTAAQPPYGSAEEPVEPGSGGGCKNAPSQPGNGGNGGGAVRIQADGTVTVHGAITANGGKGGQDRGAGGSGGGIYVNCRDFAGNGGTISANGGDSWNASGGGGGGRIALHYTNPIDPGVNVLFTAGRGLSPSTSYGTHGDIGSLWFSDASFLDLTGIRHIGQMVSPAIASSWSIPELTVNGGWVRFTTAGQHLTVANDITVSGAQGILQMSRGATLAGQADLRLMDGGSLYVYAAPTNAGSPNYSGLVSVAGTLHVGAGSWVYPQSESTNGATPRFQVGSLQIDAGGGFNADKRGYEGKNRSTGFGPGAGKRGKALSEGSGGGYGGAGGSGWDTTGSGSVLAGGGSYGFSYAPTEPGSAGGAEIDNPIIPDRFSVGGGSIRIDVLGNATMNGVLTANAGETTYGGGSGGGIFVRCTGSFTGDLGAVLSAAGGKSTYATATCGGGGGGRIAVWWNTPTSEWSGLEQGLLDRATLTTSHAAFGGVIDRSGGTGTYANGDLGSIVFLTIPPPGGTVISIR